MKTSEIPLWTETPVEGEVITHVEISPGVKRLRRVPIENVAGPEGPEGPQGPEGQQGPIGNGALTLSEMDARYVNESGDTMEGGLAINPLANSAALTVSGFSLTDANSQSILDISGTWNTSGNPIAINLDILNTASGSLSELLRLGIGGVPIFQFFASGFGMFSRLSLSGATNVYALNLVQSATGASSASAMSLFPTWNTSAAPSVIMVNVIDTASAATARFASFQVSGVDKFYIEKSGALGFLDGVRQTFNPSGVNSGVNVGSVAGNPSALVNGDIWYNSTTNALKARADGVSFNLRPLHSVLTYAATTDLDFDAGDYRSLTLAGDVTFTTSNRGAPKALAIRIIGDGSIRTLTFPAGWKFVGAAAPASLAANKIAILSVTCFGSADTDIVAAYSAEP